jgi:hypothetical protein
MTKDTTETTNIAGTASATGVARAQALQSTATTRVPGAPRDRAEWTAQEARAKQAAQEARAKWGGPPDPTPEQEPWFTDEDAEGWRTVYRGTGERRQGANRVRSNVVVPLTPEQNDWIERTAEAAGLLAPELIARLIDDARRGRLSNQAKTGEPTGVEWRPGP